MTANRLVFILMGIIAVLSILLGIKQTREYNRVVMKYEVQVPDSLILKDTNVPLIEPPLRVTQPMDPYAPFAVLKGGAESLEAFCLRIKGNDEFALNCAAARQFVLSQSQPMYMTYRKNGHILWTKHLVVVKAGELVFTDGLRSYLARCGNQISFRPQQPSQDLDPTTPNTPPVRITAPQRVERADYAPVNPVSVPTQPQTLPAPPVVQQSSRRGGWWAILATPIVVITHHNSVQVVPDKPHCDPIEYGNCSN